MTEFSCPSRRRVIIAAMFEREAAKRWSLLEKADDAIIYELQIQHGAAPGPEHAAAVS
jgi:hypothetical protein